jgi:hypothetical protein
MQHRSARGRRREGAFVVRLWREVGAPAESLRGTVEDVASRQQHAFSDLAELTEFLRRRLDSEPAEAEAAVGTPLRRS